jgi:DNA-binding GntR family transcriptional regulator
MAANRAALGQLDEAAALLPHATAETMPLLHDAYDSAFRHVLHALAGIAVLTALCITLLLGRRETVAARLSPPATS